MPSNHNDKYKAVGRKIKKLREEKKLSQNEFAELIGISMSYLSKIEAENCNKSFSLDLLFEICEKLSIDITYFFE